MTPRVVNTALQALIEHAAAFSSKENRRYADNLSLPFVHLSPGGEVLRYDDCSDVALFGRYARAKLDAERFGRTELDEARLVLDWDDLKAFYVKVRKRRWQTGPVGGNMGRRSRGQIPGG